MAPDGSSSTSDGAGGARAPWRCPSRACPFRLRHGFAAEFAQPKDKCPSCGGPVEQGQDHQPAAPRPSAWPTLARLGVTLALGAAFAGFAAVNVSIPGIAQLEVDFGDLSLQPALDLLLAAAVFVELGALALPAGRTLRHTPDGRRRLRRLALLLALLLLAVGALVSMRATPELAPASQFAVILTRCVGLPLVLGLAAANRRWGLGHGISIAFGALLIQPLAEHVLAADDPTRALVILLVLLVGAGVWLAHPARPSALGRTPLSPRSPQSSGAPQPRDLGLGLMIPSGGVIAVGLVTLTPLLIGVTVPSNSTLELALVLALTAALAFVFTRPKLLVQRWRSAFPLADPAALERDARALFRRALLRTELLVGAIVLLGQAQLPMLSVVIAVAIALDVGHELRLRLREPDLVAIQTHLDVPGAQALALALELLGKPVGLRGQHHRSLYHLLGWWIPTQILVRPADVDSAKQLRAQLLESSSRAD
ncbi:hypothetical protein DB30_05499 [Enhygromyxa salina]|uniref:Uncharacterized protein n=1 Tax=Enhygromyxa salina TaxID=215803 RepID=A0A0C2CWQ6_9BACT|nr:hypothetical protein [Enhygromyxa salina]KIG15476.1 hypothetical protein DB30_05499 [Enhygromyxa salina]